MAKRNIDTRYSVERSIEEELPPIAPYVSTYYDEPIIQTTRLVLLKNLKLNTIGPVTGNKYHFGGAGSVMDVDNRDVPKMLEMGLGNKSCCGSSSTTYFEVVR